MRTTTQRFIWMRSALLLFVIMLGYAAAWAGDVTPEQAKQQAQMFLKSRKNNTGGPLYAPGKTPSLTLRTQVSGLYVFNVSNNQGYVIVSNDDRTVPILGYSDSRSFDPDQMPDNMRAWLQGYADEIAWIQANNIQPAANAPRRVGSHSTTDIAPLMTTTWNQNDPYNRLIPNAAYGYATGCVATAMAQVMKYHEWPTAACAAIPAYGSLPELPATTFDWANMKDSYTGGFYEYQATAVATLMQYCGWSVEMNYGYTSGTPVFKVATALKSYFNYEETTQYISRSNYSYANWTDLIYNELSQGRPVVYGGQAVDNGHCFVCDGYKYEAGEDLFHINWGWGGQSDDYFVLSVLNPDEQGIGGSATASAYNFGQEAVVGIQKKGGTGTVLDVHVNTIDLSLNSTSASHATIALGESVDVTVNVKNYSADNYDGEILLMVNDALSVGKMFVIPSGATQDCVINFKPNTPGTYTLGAAFPGGDGFYYGFSELGGSFTVLDQTPTNLTAANPYYWTANIGWTNAGEATKWNLRSRPVTVTENDLNSDITGWYYINWDGDSYNWSTTPGGGIGLSQGFASPGRIGGTDLNPDEGLITPVFNLGGSFSFHAWGNGEQFMILLSTGGNYHQISGVITATGTPIEYTIDLSEYAGQTGKIAIDHYGSTSTAETSYLYVDNVTFVEPTGTWTVTENVTSNPAALTELAATTSYEVQAQAVNNDGGNWSEPIIFTTADNALTLLNDDSAADPNNTALITAWDTHGANLTLSGRTLACNNTWNTCCLPFDLPVSALALYGITNVTVKVLDNANTTLSDAGVLTLKFTDAPATIPAGMPFIIKIDKTADPIALPVIPCTIEGDATALANMTQTSSDGKVKFVGQWSTFEINASNANEIVYIGSNNQIGYSKGDRTLRCFRAHFWVEPKDGGIGARNIVFDDDEGTTAIFNVPVKGAQFENGAWYTLDGVRLQEMPTTHGVYIHNGKKVVIK